MKTVAFAVSGTRAKRFFFMTAVLCLLLMGDNLLALEAVGTIRKVEVEKNVLHVHANGRDRIVPIAEDVRVLGNDGKPLAEGLRSPELREGVEVTISVAGGGTGPVVRAIRLGSHAAVRNVVDSGKSSVGLKPLTEMTAEDRYKGEDGGLYGGGRNEPPAAHQEAAKKQTERIVPLDADGNPSKDGKIGLLSISMSNATQEYSLFKQIADRDPQKSPLVVIVDCAQGGQAMAEWADPTARAWAEADRRLEQAKVSPKQIQVVWVKLANKAPRGDLAEHGRKLQKDTVAVLHNAKARFPNLRIAYLGSRIYGGYASNPLNPEPYAYEGAFVVRWLIQDQIQGDPDLRYDDANGTGKAPLLLWGPYFWADGTTPRKSDRLIWERTDLAGDGTHPSQSGRQKVAEMLLKFFKEDALARTWFLKKSD
ncbi:MAG: hypothetical protein Q8Q12_01220 [bacterium]|nr:hypothetical protein [bacterium]